MNLKDILVGIDYKLVKGNLDTNVNNLTIDSRKVNKDTLFACIIGFQTDGHNYISKAIESGASVIVCEKDVDIREDVTVIRVLNTRISLCGICKNFYNNPSEKFNFITVTGTNGKTSTTYFMESVLGQKSDCGVIGTVEIRVNGKKYDVNLQTSTTPDTIELNQLLNVMVENKVDNVIMEVSSHSLELNKVDGLDFDYAIFTNLTQDHLDLHKSMENYLNAKAKLFTMCKEGIVNADDEYTDKIIEKATCNIHTFGIEKDCDFRARDIVYHMDKVEFTVNIKGIDERFVLNIPGRFSVYNALGVIAAASLMGISSKDIVKGIESIKGVPGRIQNVKNDKGFNVFVDYAHTPDGLENVINAVKEFTTGRVITVFGCGGDRDRKKRPIMGEISARLSDYTVITSDNPRSEEPESIILEIEQGVKSVTEDYIKITDRRDAIFKAVEIAQKGDSIIIAGKGHEDYEIFKDRVVHFDDVEVAKEALEVE